MNGWMRFFTNADYFSYFTGRNYLRVYKGFTGCVLRLPALTPD